MPKVYKQLLDLGADIKNFPLDKCGPSDDPDMQTAYLYGFRDIAKRFVSVAKRIGDPNLSDMVSQLKTSPEFITEAYDLRSELFCIIDYLETAPIKNGEDFSDKTLKKIDRYDLICKIAIELQKSMTTTGINVFLGGFGVKHDMVDIVPSKRIYVENLLSSESDHAIQQISKELGIPTSNEVVSTVDSLDKYLKRGGYDAASHDFERSLIYVESDPEQALGSASSTLESICKAILDSFQEPCPKDESLQPLVKAVFNKMDLSPDGHADEDIKRVLGGLMNSAIGIGVLRTKYSGFHGKSGVQKRKKLTGRHARLAVHACSTVGLFLIETYMERFETTG